MYALKVHHAGEGEESDFDDDMEDGDDDFVAEDEDPDE
jgi:hypothetical protein